VQASVDAKRAVFEQAKVDACLQTIRSSTCDALNMTNHLMGVPGCDSFVTPLVPLGGACTQDYECIGGWCQLPASSATGDGMCVATAAAGQSCAVGSQSCASGLTCDLKGTTDSSDDVCVQPGGIGATCTDSAMCQSGNCSSSGGSGMMCAAPTAQMCFYGGGCSTPGPDGPPGPGTIVLLGLFAAIALIRAHRAGKAATDSGYSRDA
jgi:MYXO-CTERM domain-containing protein